jgi:hypothetical protein
MQPWWATHERSPLRNTPSDARSTARWFTGTAEGERIPRRSRRHSAPNGYAGLDRWSTGPGLPGWLTATPRVRHKLAIYTIAMGLSESPVAGDERRSEAFGGRDVHPIGQSWEGVSGGRMRAAVGARSDLRLAKPLLHASNALTRFTA